MAPKIVTVIGATGAQGKGVVAAFINNPAYKVRAITRNPASPSGEALKAQGAEVVSADANSVDSLKKAFAGSAVIYAVTNFFEPFMEHNSQEKAIEIEVQQGINLAKAAAATQGLEHYIWSTLPDSSAISKGKYHVPHFQGKVQVNNYIRDHEPELFKKTTLFWVTWYHVNYIWPIFTPYYIQTAGKYLQFANYAPDTPIYTIGDVSVNIAKFVAAVVEQPSKTQNGTYVLAASEQSTSGELLQKWAKAQGTKAQFVQVSGEAFREMWGLWGDEMGVMMEYWDEAREKSWTDPAGSKVVTKEDLGIKDFQPIDEAYKTLKL